MARAMVLCAGLGTRLRPLTDELPKPLLPVGDRPLLAHIEERLRAAGLREIVVNTHHLHEEFGRVIRSLRSTFHVVHEPEILGTAGGIAGARHLLEPPPVVVWNGDILAEPPLAELLARSSEGGACLAVHRKPRGAGTVGLDARGSVVRLRGQTFGDEVGGGDYIGVAGLGTRALAALPTRGCFIGDLCLEELRSGGSVDAVVVDGLWNDIGTLEAYLQVNLQWLAARPPGEQWIGPGARIAPGVEVRSSILGAGARATGVGRLERCVVWPGATVVAPLTDAVITRGGQVVRVALA